MSLSTLFSDRNIVLIYLFILLVQYNSNTILGGTTIIKLALLGLSPFFILFKAPYVNKAFILCVIFIFSCFIIAYLHGNMRISTIGFSAMYVTNYIIIYNLIHSHSITTKEFILFVRFMIIIYGIVLLLQQICLLIGLHNVYPINLSNQFYISLFKLPSLSLEPSHSARILTALVLVYLRCLELTNNGVKPTIANLFNKKNRLVMILFLWSMLTMGSGTAFIGLGLLCFYFIQKRTLIYAIPILLMLLFIGNSLNIHQMDRALRVTQATLTGDVKKIQVEDGSASSRIIPIINTLTIDLTSKDSWIGKGTSSHKKATTSWRRTTDKISIVEQYGLITFFISLLLVYTCMIRKILSIESLYFIILLGMSLLNVYYYWGIMMLFSIIKYFQEQNIKGYNI